MKSEFGSRRASRWLLIHLGGPLLYAHRDHRQQCRYGSIPLSAGALAMVLTCQEQGGGIEEGPKLKVPRLFVLVLCIPNTCAYIRDRPNYSSSIGISKYSSSHAVSVRTTLRRTKALYSPTTRATKRFGGRSPAPLVPLPIL